VGNILGWGPLKIFLGPLGHTFEKVRAENDIFTWNVSSLAEKISSEDWTKDLGGPHFAHPWYTGKVRGIGIRTPICIPRPLGLNCPYKICPLSETLSGPYTETLQCVSVYRLSEYRYPWDQIVRNKFVC